ncbi:MAG: hypothetical protein VXZ69_00575, partial [Pseudomonadota bacterium]|nr:hypothetical protein [Pseudomonadota bacterium]
IVILPSGRTQALARHGLVTKIRLQNKGFRLLTIWHCCTINIYNNALASCPIPHGVKIRETGSQRPSLDILSNLKT